MTTVTIPNRPKGTDVRSIEQILANFDAVTTVINGELGSDNFLPGTFPTRVVDIQGTATAGLTNTTLAIPTNNCEAVYTTAAAGAISVAARAVVDKTVGTGAVYCGLFLDGVIVPSIRTGGAGLGNVEANRGGDAPTVSLLFATGDPTFGFRFDDISGSGDWTGISPATAQMIGIPLEIYVPAGTHTFALAFCGDAGVTYSVMNQAMAIKV